MVDINNALFSTTDASNSAASPNGYNSSTTPANVVAIEQALRGAVKRWWERSGPAITAGGTGNAITYTPSNVSYPTAYVQGDVYVFLASAANTGATTLAVNGLSALAVKKNSSTGLATLSGGEIQSGAAAICLYDGTQFELINPSPVSAPSGTNPTGAIIIWSTTTAPTGYLECNGAQVSQTTYSQLYGVIGTIYGAASGGNFTLPDFRGYFPRGWADNGSIDSGRTIGTTQQNAVGPLVVTDPEHDHTVSIWANYDGHNPPSLIAGTNTSVNSGVFTTASSPTGISVAGVNSASETRPINLAVMFCIKT